MATNQEGPMTPGTHADLVARLREHARCLDLANEPAGATEARDISDALAALPPPADPPATAYDFAAEARIVCEAIGSDVGWMTVQCALREAFAAGAQAADPPALVALEREVAELRHALWNIAGTVVAICDDSPREHREIACADTSPLVGQSREYIERFGLSNKTAPLPAAPPVTDTPQPGEVPPSSTWTDIGPQPKGWPDANNHVRWKDCVIGVYCQRHGFIHGQEAEELRERLEELGNTAVNRVLDEVDARDSVAYLEATNEPTPPDAAPAAPPQEDQ